MLKKLRTKFILIIMVIALVFLINVTGIIVYNICWEISAEYEGHLVYRIENYINGISKGNPNGDGPPRGLLYSFMIAEKGADGKYKIVASRTLEPESDEALQEYCEDALEEKQTSGILFKHRLRYFRWVDDSLIAFMNCSDELQVYMKLFRTSALSDLGVLVLMFGISFFLARWAVKPVESAWKQQNQFISDVSHELKTPLTVILTNTEMLQSDEPDNRYVQSIDVMSQQMRGLVESLLELARMDNAGETLCREPINMTKLVNSALLPFEPVFFEKELTLESDIADGVSTVGSADHIMQVVGVLLDNAQKYTSEHGSVKVKLSQVKNNCCLSVASTGEEISPEDLVNIFRRFYRVDKVRSMNHSYGLGLSVAKSIVERHEGRIWAESKDGVNTFFVTLPIKKAEAGK
ncbi:MAG: HAMP domain-containing histidine kinase [Oscillospiraceae bacterium]|nr:HAMP domain-containing histidine kinase [Oscillospiraceae bacterium]